MVLQVLVCLPILYWYDAIIQHMSQVFERSVSNDLILQLLSLSKVVRLAVKSFENDFAFIAYVFLHVLPVKTYSWPWSVGTLSSFPHPYKGFLLVASCEL